MNEQLTKYDIGWIFAAKWGVMEEFYKLEYPFGKNNPEKVTTRLIGSIVRQVISRARGWNEAVDYIMLNVNLYKYREGKDMFGTENLEPNQLAYYAFIDWAHSLTITALKKLCPEFEEYRLWFEEEYKAIQAEIDSKEEGEEE